jgi:hypothetical protein
MEGELYVICVARLIVNTQAAVIISLYCLPYRGGRFISKKQKWECSTKKKENKKILDYLEFVTLYRKEKPLTDERRLKKGDVY